MAWFVPFIILFCLNGWMINAVEYRLEGKSYIVYSTAAKSFSKTLSTIHMLFRTAEPFGMLLYARGTTGDFITLEIVRGKLRYASVFDRDGGKPGTYDVIVGDDLGDNQWHQIDIKRDKNHVTIILDVTRKHLSAQRDQKYQNINRDIIVAGLPPSTKDIPRNSSIPRVSLTGANFTGCMEDVSFNKINIFQATKEKSKEVRILGDLRPKCANDADDYSPATLTKSSSFIKIDIGGQNINLKLEFRTFDHSGVLIHYSFGSTGQLFLELMQGKIELFCNAENFSINAIIAQKHLTYAEGVWHKIQLNLTSKGVRIQVNNGTIKKFNNISGTKDFFQNPKLKIGTSLLRKYSMKGCVRDIQLNGKDVEVKSTMTQGVQLKTCYLNDLCFTNLCLHKGVCKQHNNIVQCDCTNTGYYGQRCENISSLTYTNTTSTRNTPSYVTTDSSRVLPATVRPSQSISGVIKTISKSITTDSNVTRSPSTREVQQPITSSSFTKPGTIPTNQTTNSALLRLSLETSTAKPKHAITKIIKTPSKAKPRLSITLASKQIPSTARPRLSITLASKQIPSTARPRLSITLASKQIPFTAKARPSITSVSKQIPTKQPKRPTSPTRKEVLAANTTIPIRKQTSPSPPNHSTTTMLTPQIPKTPTMENISPSTSLSKYSVRLSEPTAQKPTHGINTQVIIIHKSNTITNVGFNKNQFLVYLFLFILFVLFVGLVVIISTKLSYFEACPRLRRSHMVNGSLGDQDSIELGNADREDRIRGVNQCRVKTERPSSLNDSGIDRSDSGSGSHRSSAEVHDEAINDSENLDSSIEGDTREGFLILQEPVLFTQKSFGWTVLDSSSTIRHCRTSTRDLLHAADENKPQAFRSAYYPHSGTSDVAEDDISDTSEARYKNPTTKYRQLATSDSSSLGNVSVDLEECNKKVLERNSPPSVEEQCPVF